MVIRSVVHAVDAAKKKLLTVFALTEYDPKLSGNAPWAKTLDTLRGQVCTGAARCAFAAAALSLTHTHTHSLSLFIHSRDRACARAHAHAPPLSHTHAHTLSYQYP